MPRLLCFPLLVVLLPCAARAQQQRPAAAVLETQAAEGVPDGTSGAVDRMVRARLDGLDVVHTSTGVALDLAEVQLALGCVGETVECLTPVANELSVRYLLIPNLDSTDGQLMLTVALFDREAGTIARAVRRSEGERARTDLLDAVDGQLRELFGLPPPPTPDPDPDPDPEMVVVPSGGVGAGSVFVFGLGLVALGVGTGTAVAFLDAETQWRTARPTTAAEADAAHDAYVRAETFAIAADILFVAGGVAAGVGLIWLVAEAASSGGTPQPRRRAGIVPFVSPAAFGAVARLEVD